jgi:hypothetical protein
MTQYIMINIRERIQHLKEVQQVKDYFNLIYGDNNPHKTVHIIGLN